MPGHSSAVLSAILTENENIPIQLAKFAAEAHMNAGFEQHETALRSEAAKYGWVMTGICDAMVYFDQQLVLDDPISKLHLSQQVLIDSFDSPKELVTIGDVREFLLDGYGILPYVIANSDVVRDLYLIFVHHKLL